MKWLYKLEYKHGNRYIRNLMMYIVGGMVLVYLAQMLFSFNVTSYLSLSRAAILQGQIWRLVTFIFLPNASGIFMLLLSLYFYYMMGTSLERVWGGFRFNVYYLIGIIGAIIACFVSPYGISTNTYLNLSLFLAFATIAPDTQFLLFFFIPIKAKWLGLAYAAFLAFDIVTAFISSPLYGVSMLIVLAFSLVNYLMFFGRSLLETIQNQIRIMKNRRNWRNGNS